MSDTLSTNNALDKFETRDALDTLETNDALDRLARALHAFVARAPAKILMIQLEDLLGQVEQVNVPGTTDERYPNWRRKLPASIEDWTKDERVKVLLDILRDERG